MSNSFRILVCSSGGSWSTCSDDTSRLCFHRRLKTASEHQVPRDRPFKPYCKEWIRQKIDKIVFQLLYHSPHGTTLLPGFSSKQCGRAGSLSIARFRQSSRRQGRRATLLPPRSSALSNGSAPALERLNTTFTPWAMNWEFNRA